MMVEAPNMCVEIAHMLAAATARAHTPCDNGACLHGLDHDAHKVIFALAHLSQQLVLVLGGDRVQLHCTHAHMHVSHAAAQPASLQTQADP